MIKINVQSLPLFEVIKDIASAFNTTFEEHCGEYHLTIPQAIGEGYIKGINFDGGFGIIIYQCTFNEDVEIQFIVNKVHPLKFLYCLKGGVHHRFQDAKETNIIEQYQSAIVASESYNGHILHFQAKVETQIGSLEIDREKFQDKVNCELNDLDPQLRSLFTDHTAKSQFYHNGYYSLHTADLFSQIETFENNDFVRRIFLEGQAYEILTHQILQYHDDLNEDTNRSVLRQSEMVLVRNAANRIKYDLSELDTVEGIASEIGINPNKLQIGFKHLYGMTVNSFIQQTRLELAKSLLRNTDYNISEIVEKVGLSSKSYFSKIFKETYNITPSEFKKRNKRKISGIE